MPQRKQIDDSYRPGGGRWLATGIHQFGAARLTALRRSLQTRPKGSAELSSELLEKKAARAKSLEPPYHAIAFPALDTV